MKRYMLLTLGTAALFSAMSLRAQATADISGDYFVAKDQSTVEIVRDGIGYRITQRSTPVAKNEPNNGKVRAVIADAEAKSLAGTVTDFDSGKQYKATWTPSANGDTLTMRVKVSLLHFSYQWTRQSVTTPLHDQKSARDTLNQP